MGNTTLTPKDFATRSPMASVLGKAEAETVARNIMVILARTGNEWRQLGWNEYERERNQDGNFDAVAEKHYFDRVIIYTESPIVARVFAPGWKI